MRQAFTSFISFDVICILLDIGTLPSLVAFSCTKVSRFPRFLVLEIKAFNGLLLRFLLVLIVLSHF